ncbi:MAG: hypothetical protein CSA21_05705 [Deltaproteobacteria bacterium]|nr:MAG: hypothetical protein CSA21_05705 [Deltaproteobacteria bacterium]
MDTSSKNDHNIMSGPPFFLHKGTFGRIEKTHHPQDFMTWLPLLQQIPCGSHNNVLGFEDGVDVRELDCYVKGS